MAWCIDSWVPTASTAECAPEPVGEFLHLRDELLAAFGEDVGGAELAGQGLSVGVTAGDDDPLRAELAGREDGAESHGAVPDDGDGLAGAGLGRDRPEPAGAEDVGGGQQRRDEVGVRLARGGDQGAVGERDAHALGLSAAGGTEDLPVHAGGLVAGQADLAGVVGGEERSDDEVADLDVPHVRADLLDDAGVLVAHVEGLGDLVGAAVGPQVRPADAGRGQADDRVGGLHDGGFGDVLDTDVSGGVHHDSAHRGSPRFGRPARCRQAG
jgi:hypothetical protein